MPVYHPINSPEKLLVNGSMGNVVTFSRPTGPSTYPLLPVVHWHTNVTKPFTQQVLPVPLQRLSRDALGDAVALPLRHAAAITIHKSQGLNLSTAIVDAAGGLGTENLLLLALSRTPSLDHVQLLNFDPTRDVAKVILTLTPTLTPTPTLTLTPIRPGRPRLHGRHACACGACAPTAPGRCSPI